MANDEHVALLKQGVNAWNGWRKENPDIRPDLSRVDLTGANLVEANFNRADLIGANLTGAKLKRADLRMANLGGAHLNRAELEDAYLSFRMANLGGAELVAADLNSAARRRGRLRRAQQPAMPVVGFVNAGSSDAPLAAAFRKGLNEGPAHVSDQRQRRDAVAP